MEAVQEILLLNSTGQTAGHRNGASSIQTGCGSLKIKPENFLLKINAHGLKRSAIRVAGIRQAPAHHPQQFVGGRRALDNVARRDHAAKTEEKFNGAFTYGAVEIKNQAAGNGEFDGAQSKAGMAP